MRPTTISFSVYALLWLVLIVLQTLTTSLQGPAEASVFTNPSLYYSTWLTDLYLILLFYLNYYVLAPQMMRKRLFRPYLWIVVVAALIGLLLPLLCYSLWGMTMPGFAPDTAPVSSLGVVGAVASIALGLCVRGLIEWSNLSEEVAVLKQEKEELRAESDLLREKLENIQHTQLRAASSAVATSVIDPTEASHED